MLTCVCECLNVIVKISNNSLERPNSLKFGNGSMALSDAAYFEALEFLKSVSCKNFFFVQSNCVFKFCAKQKAIVQQQLRREFNVTNSKFQAKKLFSSWKIDKNFVNSYVICFVLSDCRLWVR